MKKIPISVKFISKFALTALFMLAFVFSASSVECGAGGEGSSSCTYESVYLFGALTLTGTTSCGEGFYACCGTNSGACIKEGSGKKNQDVCISDDLSDDC